MSGAVDDRPAPAPDGGKEQPHQCHRTVHVVASIVAAEKPLRASATPLTLAVPAATTARAPPGGRGARSTSPGRISCDESGDTIRGELILRDEAEGRALGDEIREVRFAVRGDQHDTNAVFAGQPVCEVQAAVGSEIEVHEHAVGLQLVDEACGVIARRRDREDVGALLFQQISCGSEEVRVVVHDDEPRGHDPYIRSTVVEQRSDLTPSAFRLAAIRALLATGLDLQAPTAGDVRSRRLGTADINDRARPVRSVVVHDPASQLGPRGDARLPEHLAETTHGAGWETAPLPAPNGTGAFVVALICVRTRPWPSRAEGAESGSRRLPTVGSATWPGMS